MSGRARVELRVALPIWAIAAVVMLTHLGGHSPYTYGWATFGGNVDASSLEGQHVNPDALSVWPLTVGFYAPCGVAYHAPNVLFPFHALCATVLVALTGSYMLGMWLLNAAAIAVLVWAIVRACAARGYPPGAIVVAGTFVVTLPWIVCYAGQPLHYLFAGCVAGCVAIAAVELARTGAGDPWRWGGLVAVLTLTYDWYVFGAAIVLVAIGALRLARPRDAVAFAVAAFGPTIAWHALLSAAGGDQVSTRVARTFVVPVKAAYAELLGRPLSHLLDLYMLPHIGLDVGFRAAVDAIGWPLVVVTVVLLWRMRRAVPRSPAARMAGLLFALYALEQAAVAVMDSENSPRRALPAVCAVAMAAAWIAARAWASPAARVAVVALAVVCFGTSLVDRFARNPAVQELDMGEVVRGDPKMPAYLVGKNITGDAFDAVTADAPLPIGAFRPVCDHLVDQSLGRGLYANKVVVREAHPADASGKTPAQRWTEYAAAQVLLIVLGAALLLPMTRAGLLPRQAPAVAALLLFVSYLARLR